MASTSTNVKIRYELFGSRVRTRGVLPAVVGWSQLFGPWLCAGHSKPCCRVIEGSDTRMSAPFRSKVSKEIQTARRKRSSRRCTTTVTELAGTTTCFFLLGSATPELTYHVGTGGLASGIAITIPSADRPKHRSSNLI